MVPVYYAKKNPSVNEVELSLPQLAGHREHPRGPQVQFWEKIEIKE